jgi:hypothetical protein
MIDNSPENLNKDNDRFGIYHTTKGLDPKKYFRKISPYDIGKPEVEAALDKEMLAEYERDQEKTEREAAREKAQYFQDLKIIEKSNHLHQVEENNLLMQNEIPSFKASIASPQARISIDELENSFETGELIFCLENVLNGGGRLQFLLKEQDFYSPRDHQQLNDFFLLIDDSPSERIMIWIMKMYIVYTIWHPTEEPSIKFEIFSESIQMADNLFAALLSMNDKITQRSFLSTVAGYLEPYLTRIKEENYERLFVYTLQLLTTLMKNGAFSIGNLPPTFDEFIRTGNLPPENKSRKLLSNEVIELQNDGFTALLTILEAAKGTIIKGYKKAQLARIFQESSSKVRSTIKQGREGELTDKLQRFIINLCTIVQMSPNAKERLLVALSSEIKKIKPKESKE